MVKQSIYQRGFTLAIACVLKLIASHKYLVFLKER
jgi:hypothetical protein